MTALEDIKEFYHRSVDSRTATGVPQPFVVSSGGSHFDTQPIHRVDQPKASLSVDDTKGLPPPTIDSFYPYWGDYRGGDLVDIKGTNFIDGCKVYFDNIESTNVTFVNSTELKAVTPSDATFSSGAKDVPVKVANVPGIEDELSSFRYQYPPTFFSWNGSLSPLYPGTYSYTESAFLSGSIYYSNYIGTMNISIVYNFLPSPTSYISVNPATIFFTGIGSFTITPNGPGIGFSIKVTDARYGVTSSSLGLST